VARAAAGEETWPNPEAQRQHAAAAEARLAANILLVDDEPKSLFALRELLSGLGENVITARSGEEALRLALTQDFAVIVLDVRMPGLDGFEAARIFRDRERSQSTPLIFLTAAAQEPGAVFRGYEVGAVDYLIKPVIPEVLRSKVAVFVELYRKSAHLKAQIRERMLAEERARRSEERLRALAARLQSIREEERSHIAREIHDELGQVLTGLKMDLSWLAGRLRSGDPKLIEKCDSMAKLIDTTIRKVRDVSAGLRPQVLDEMGLVAAIGWHARDFQRRTGIRCKAQLPAAETPGLDPDLATSAFRIVQEILTNVARHARASRVDLELKVADGLLSLEIADNGIGITEERRNNESALGLLGVRERALLFGGDVTIAGAPGRGTRVSVSIPVPGGAA
jgi:signal transduction histidine kinase